MLCQAEKVGNKHRDHDNLDDDHVHVLRGYNERSWLLKNKNVI